MLVSEAPAGASFRVLRVRSGGEVGKRLADMGFTEGAEGAVVRGGFLRGPLQVRIRGYDILIRRSEASEIEVEPIGDWSAAIDAARALKAEMGEGGARRAWGHGASRGSHRGSGHGNHAQEGRR